MRNDQSITDQGITRSQHLEERSKIVDVTLLENHPPRQKMDKLLIGR